MLMQGSILYHSMTANMAILTILAFFYALTQYGHEYGHHLCQWKDQEKYRSPMKTELKKLRRLELDCPTCTNQLFVLTFIPIFRS